MGCRLCSPTAPGRCLHFECRGAPARVRAWRCEGRPPLPHHFVCVETFTLPLPHLPRPVPVPDHPAQHVVGSEVWVLELAARHRARRLGLPPPQERGRD